MGYDVRQARLKRVTTTWTDGFTREKVITPWYHTGLVKDSKSTLQLSLVNTPSNLLGIFFWNAY